MDVWFFATAASAAYVAQQVRHLSFGNRNWPSDILKSGRVGTPAIIHKAFDKGDEFQKGRMCRHNELHSDDSCAEETVSGNGFQGYDKTTLNEVCDSDSSCGLENDGLDFNEVARDTDEVMVSESSIRPSAIEVGFLFGSKQAKCSLRSKAVNRKNVKPQTSLESCLLAQLWNYDSRIEEHASWRVVLHTLPFSGSRILNRSHFGWYCETSGFGNSSLLDKMLLEPGQTASGIPKLPNIALKKSLFTARNKRSQLLSRSNANKLVPGGLEKTEGTSNDLVLFSLGLTIGVLCCTSVSLLEMEKLRKSLAYTESLMQDLHDELEMKDSLTVRELTAENNELLDSSDLCLNSSKHHIEQQCLQDEEDESFKKIEAELEVEWDRLQSNMNLFQLENTSIDVDEMSPDFIPYIAEGELKAECFSRREDSPCYSERYRSSVPTPSCSQYPVSPRLLSLKMHEVIQSRLNDRIKQLETELRNMTKSSESEYILSDSMQEPDYETGSPSPSPGKLQSNNVPAPYYEEVPTFFSECDTEEGGNHEDIFVQEKQEVSLNVHPEQHIVLKDECRSWSESENGDDEMERLLIQQIVEKARQGSPAILKAKRALFSTDTGSIYRQELDGEVAEASTKETDYTCI